MKQILPIIILVTFCSFVVGVEEEAGFTDLEMNGWKARVTEIDDPIGLGERLALIDYFQEELKQKVTPSTSLEDLRVSYWRIHAAEERRLELYNILVNEYGVKDLDKNLSYRSLLKKRVTADHDKETARLMAEGRKSADDKVPGEQDQEVLEDYSSEAVSRLEEARKRLAENSAKRREEFAEQERREAEERTLEEDELRKHIVAKEMEIKAGDGALYMFNYPEGLRVTKNNPREGIPPTIMVKSAHGKMSLVITFFPPTSKGVKTQKELNNMVKDICGRQYESGSAERKTVITELKVNGGLGAIAQYTDKDLVKVERPKPGQYKVIGSGLLVFGNNLANVTLLGESFDSADYKVGISLLENGFTKKEK